MPFHYVVLNGHLCPWTQVAVHSTEAYAALTLEMASALSGRTFSVVLR